MTFQVRSVGNGLHPVGSLSIANYALNPSMEVADPAQTSSARINLCTNPGFETGTTGWTVAGGVPPTISATPAQAMLGTQSCKVVSNGTASFTNNLTYTAGGLTIGATYTFSAYVYLPTGFFTGSVGCGLAGGALGSASSTFNAWTRISITVTATATSHGFFVYSNTYTSGQSFFVDAVLLEASSTVGSYFDGSNDLFLSRTNLCTNPSFETGTTGWALGGSVTPTLASSSTQHVFGTKSGLITWPATGSLPLIDFAFTTVVGAIYTVSAFVYVPTGSPNVLLTVSGFGLAGQTDSVKDQWQRLTYTFAAIATTSHLQFLATSPGVGTCYIDGVLIELGSLGNYFDGSLPPFNTTHVTQAWTGTAHGSTSTQSVPVGLVAWNGTANASASTRWDTGVKWWTTSNAVVSQIATNRERGMYCAKMVPTTISLMPRMSQTFTVLDNTNYSISLSLFLPATITGGGVLVEFSPYDITNTLIQGPDTTTLLLTGAPTLGFIRLATTYQTPTGTNTVAVAIRPTNQPSSTSDAILIDTVLFEQTDSASQQYFDGDTAGYVWSGTPGESTTLQTEFPDALNFFGTYIWQNFNSPGSTIALGAHATLHEAPWSPVPLTD